MPHHTILPIAEPHAIEAAFHRSFVALVITAEDGTLLAANPAAHQLLGDGEGLSDDRLLHVHRAATLADESAATAPRRLRLGTHELQLHTVVYASANGQLFNAIELVDITAFRRRERLLLDRLERDSLTGLTSREAFFRAAARLIEERRRVARPLAVAMIDLDHFKTVNDRAGHATGDRVLAGVAACCRQGLREGDVVGRLSGDELAILLPGASMADAAFVAERIRAALRQASGTAVLGGQTMTLSIGLAYREPDEASIDPALERADRALYAAKTAGGDRIVCHGN